MKIMKYRRTAFLFLLVATLTAVCMPAPQAAFIGDRPNKLMEEKWDALEDAQKDEIYSLLEKRNEAERNLLEKLSSCGFLDSALSRSIIEKLEDETSRVKENRSLPDFLRRPPVPKENRN